MCFDIIVAMKTSVDKDDKCPIGPYLKANNLSNLVFIPLPLLSMFEDSVNLKDLGILVFKNTPENWGRIYGTESIPKPFQDTFWAYDKKLKEPKLLNDFAFLAIPKDDIHSFNKISFLISLLYLYNYLEGKSIWNPLQEDACYSDSFDIFSDFSFCIRNDKSLTFNFTEGKYGKGIFAKDSLPRVYFNYWQPVKKVSFAIFEQEGSWLDLLKCYGEENLFNSIYLFFRSHYSSSQLNQPIEDVQKVCASFEGLYGLTKDDHKETSSKTRTKTYWEFYKDCLIARIGDKLGETQFQHFLNFIDALFEKAYQRRHGRSHGFQIIHEDSIANQPLSEVFKFIFAYTYIFFVKKEKGIDLGIDVDIDDFINKFFFYEFQRDAIQEIKKILGKQGVFSNFWNDSYVGTREHFEVVTRTFLSLARYLDNAVSFFDLKLENGQTELHSRNSFFAKENYDLCKKTLEKVYGLLLHTIYYCHNEKFYEQHLGTCNESLFLRLYNLVSDSKYKKFSFENFAEIQGLINELHREPGYTLEGFRFDSLPENCYVTIELIFDLLSRLVSMVSECDKVLKIEDSTNE